MLCVLLLLLLFCVCRQTHACANGYTCTNTPGSFTCTNDSKCASDPCPTGYTCTDTPGSFVCTSGTVPDLFFPATSDGHRCTHTVALSVVALLLLPRLA
mgnify:CR=1 FL=1